MTTWEQSSRRFAGGFMALSLAWMLTGGCSHIRYGTHDPTGVEHSQWSHFFLFGLAGREEVNASDLCPNGVARIHTYTSFVNGLVTIFPGLLGLIWAPRSVEITCKGGASASLDLDANGHATAVRMTTREGVSRRRSLDEPIAYVGPESLEEGGQP